MSLLGLDRRGWSLSAARGLVRALGVGERGLPDAESIEPPVPMALLPRAADLNPAQRRLATAPLRGSRAGLLRWEGEVVRQVDDRTCGAAVLVLLAAAGDRTLAAWLQTGTRIGPVMPPELRGLSREQLRADTVAERLTLAQHVVFARARRGALAGWGWPAGWGIPPWALARAARYRGVTYTHAVVHDRDVADTRAVLDAVHHATRLGIGVPLYTGGDLGPGGSIAQAMPRHVVLALPYRGRDDHLRIYEPSTGRIFAVVRNELHARMRRKAALGNWSHLTWAVLPASAYR